MVLTDPRATFRGYFTPGSDNKVTPGNLTREDGSNASYTSQYDYDPTPAEDFFFNKDYDIGFIIYQTPLTALGPPTSPIGYTYTVGIEVCTVNKRKDNSSLKVFGQKLLWQGVQEVERVIHENSVGSIRSISRGRPTTRNVGFSPLYSIMVEVEYVQYVSVYGTYTVANRRFYDKIKELRVGVAGTSGNYSSVGEASGLGPLTLEPNDPIVIVSIPGAANYVRQLLGNYGGKATMMVRDQEAVTQLFKTIDVDNDVAGTQVAVSASSRTVIDYLAVVAYNTKIVNATDGRTSATTVLVFNGALIGREPFPLWDEPGSPWLVEWYYNSITQSDT